MPSAVVQLQLQSQVAPQIAATANAYKSLSAAEQAAEQAATRYSLALNKVALADAQTATQEQKLAVQTANVAKAQSQAEAAALRLSNAQVRGASGMSFASQTADAFKSSILGIIGPAALVAGGFAALSTTANFFKESFNFKAQLDQTTTSIGLQLRGVRDVAVTFDEARGFANKYKLTQEETAAAIQASIPILRQSNESLTSVESTLLRLQAKKPEKSIADAARALDELKSGQIISIVDQFNVSRDSANAMKNEIAGGADAVQVLSRYLTNAGIGMNALEARTRGATGAINDQKVAYEKLRLAAGGASGGPGLAITKATTAVTTDAADQLAGQQLTFQARNFAVFATQLGYTQSKADALGLSLAQMLGYTNATAEVTQLASGSFDEERSAIGRAQIAAEGLRDIEQRRITQAGAVAQAIRDARSAIDTFNAGVSASADKSALDASQKDAQSAATNKVAYETKSASDAFIALNPKLDASQAFAAAAAQGLGPLVSQVIALRLEADKTRAALLGEKLKGQSASALTGSNSEEAQLRKSNRATLDSDRTADIAKDRAAAAATAKARIDQTLKTGTAIQVVAERQREYNAAVAQYGANSAQAIDAQTTLISARQSIAKSHTAELGKQLRTNEQIYDSLNKQKDAALDIEELLITGRQADRADAQKIKTAKAILGSSTASADFKARAQDALDLISVQERKRAQALLEKGATAGGTIGPGGKLFQSVPGGAGAGVGPPGSGAPIGALPSAGGPPGGAGAASGGMLSVIVQIDGKTAWSGLSPFAMDDLLKAINGARAARGI